MELTLHEMSVRAQTLKDDWYPWLDVVHITLTILTIRKEAGMEFSRNHPFATWLASIVASFAGSVIANPLLGKPILDAFNDRTLVTIATVVVWIVFYSPQDLGFKLLTSNVVNFPMCCLKEILRAKKVLSGFKEGLALYPHKSALFIPVMIGLIKGNGSSLITPLTRFICGKSRLMENEILRPSLTSKLCALAALVFAFFDGHFDLAYVIVVGTFLAVKISHLMGQPEDPFKPFERMLFGFLRLIADGNFQNENDK